MRPGYKYSQLLWAAFFASSIGCTSTSSGTHANRPDILTDTAFADHSGDLQPGLEVGTPGDSTDTDIHISDLEFETKSDWSNDEWKAGDGEILDTCSSDLSTPDLIDLHDQLTLDSTDASTLDTLPDVTDAVNDTINDALADAPDCNPDIPGDGSGDSADSGHDIPDISQLDLADTELTVDCVEELISDTGPTCPYGNGQCENLLWYWCHPDTGEIHVTDCSVSKVCIDAGCSAETGCTQALLTGSPCSDGNSCTVDDKCLNGGCISGPKLHCDDGFSCQDGACICTATCGDSVCGSSLCGESCGSCDDGSDCIDGQCLCQATCGDSVCGLSLCGESCGTCGDGSDCIDGQCECQATCGDALCGENSCGESCGSCQSDESCLNGNCVGPSYPSPPYGPFQGDVLPLQTFLLPDDLSPFTSANWYGDGKVLLITFNAGWCIVCKKDTAVLNEWLATYEEDGLRVASILYENWNGAPVSQEYALFWQTNYETQYTMLMDQPDTDETGDAIGGALGVYLQPEGPVPNDTFPVTLLVCPATMKILYISSGFYDDVVHAGVMKWLYDQDCSDY